MPLNDHEEVWLSENWSGSVLTAVLLLSNVKLIRVTQLRILLIRFKQIIFWGYIYIYIYIFIHIHIYIYIL